MKPPSELHYRHRGAEFGPQPHFLDEFNTSYIMPRSRRAAIRRGRFETLFDSYENLPKVRLSGIVAGATKPP